MARSDLILSLVKANQEKDQILFKHTLEAIIAEERSKQHNTFADKLATFLPNIPKKDDVSQSEDEISDLLYEINPKITLDDVYLTQDNRKQFQDFIEENHRADLLRSYDLEPRNRILLIGSPGNGKTTTAEAIAEALMVPMFVVRYESLIGSYLGESSQNIKKVINFVSQRRCVLFFDEFDAVSKERGDAHEVGEIKRIVNSLLLQLDKLPNYVTLIAASNHSELLDKAVWRRFQLKLQLCTPTQEQISLWLSDFSKNNSIKFNIPLSELSKELEGFSYSDLKEFGSNLQRKEILSKPDGFNDKIINNELQQAKRSMKISRVQVQ